MHLRKKKRNHLGLEDPPSLPQGPGITSRDSKSYKEDLDAWLERNDTCLSIIYDTTAKDNVAREVVEQFVKAASMLPSDHPDKEPKAKDLLKKLTERFRGEKQDEILLWSNKFTGFKIQAGEKPSEAVNRLKGILLKLKDLNQEVRQESQTAKLKQALHVKELQQLWLMQGDLTFEQIATTCKRYDEAIKDSMFTARRDIAEGK